MTEAAAAAYRLERGTRASRVGGVIGVLLLAGLVAVPYWADRASMRMLSEVASYLALAQLWNLLAGYAGLVSVGQQAYVGIGGYVLFLLAIHAGLDPIAGVAFAGLVAGLFAAPTAPLLFRLRGPHFAIGTWVVAEVFRLSFAQVSMLGGGSGMSLPPAVVRTLGAAAERDAAIFWTALVLAAGVTAILYLLLRSRYGLALAAVRDAEVAAESLGVDQRRIKFAVYVLASALAGAVGALIFLTKLRIAPDAAFSLMDWTATVIFIVVIGGVGTLEGPIAGVIVFFLLRETLSGLGSWYLVILGAVAIAVMLKAPHGLWGLLADRFDLHLFPLRRRLRVDRGGEPAIDDALQREDAS